MAKATPPIEPLTASDDLPTTPTEEVSTSSIDKLTQMIGLLIKSQVAAAAGSGAPNPQMTAMMEGLTAALNRVSDNQLAGAKAISESYRQVHRPSNEVVPFRSVYDLRGNPNLHPEGANYVRPLLKCVCWIPREETPANNMLTREEVELLNILTRCPGTYIVKRVDDTKFKLMVKVEYGIDEVTPSKMVFVHDTSFNQEYFRLMPALHSVLRQVLAQHSDDTVRRAAKEVLTMEEEELLIAAGKLSVAA